MKEVFIYVSHLFFLDVKAGFEDVGKSLTLTFTSFNLRQAVNRIITNIIIFSLNVLKEPTLMKCVLPS